MARYRLADRTAVLTGAGSGIGRALAHDLASRGTHLALVERDEARLAEVAGEVRGRANVRVTTHALDVTDRDGSTALPAAVEAAHGGADLLFNNAGIALEGRFDQLSEADYDRVMEVNFHAVVRLTRAFLPLMKRSDDARIVNVSSIFGVIAPAGQTAYSASKFAVRGFTMALSHELDGTNVGATVVHPGGVSTNIARDAKLSSDMTDDEKERRLAAAMKNLSMPPPRAAAIILRGVERRRRRVFVGADAALAQRIERLMPSSYWALVRRVAGEL